MIAATILSFASASEVIFYVVGLALFTASVLTAIRNDLQSSLKALVPTQVFVCGGCLLIFGPMVYGSVHMLRHGNDLSLFLFSQSFLGSTYTLSDENFRQAFQSDGNNWEWEQVVKEYRGEEYSYIGIQQKLSVKDPLFSLEKAIAAQKSMESVDGLSAVIDFTTFEKNDSRTYTTQQLSFYLFV